MRVKLHDHQEVAVDEMHNGCILYGDVGVGKTITSLGYYFTKVCGGTINEWGSMQTPKDVIVITTAKVRDSKAFELQAALYGVHANRELSTNGVSITVDSWNNLHKYVEVKNAFFIFDEQRVVGYGAWARAFIKIAKSNEWILLSATPGDTWLDYIPVFIANGWYKHKTEFEREHVVWTPRVKYPKVLRYQNVGVLVRRRNEVLVRMHYERHTTRHHVDVWCDYDQDAFNKAVKKRWHVFEKRPLRDVAELFSVMRKVVNSDTSRLRAVESLMTKHPKLIVFYNFDYELEMLRSLSSPSLSEGGTSSEPRMDELSSTQKERANGSMQETSPSPTQSGDSSNLQTLDQSLSPSQESPTPSRERSSTEASTTSSRQSTKVASTSNPQTLGDLDPTARCTASEPCATHQTSDSQSSRCSTTGYWTNDEGEGEEWIPTTSDSTSQTTSGSARSSHPSEQSTDGPCPSTRAQDESSSSPSSTSRCESSPRSSSSSSAPTTSTSSDTSSSTTRLATGSKSGSTSPSPSSTGSSTALSEAAQSSTPSFAIAEWNGHKHEEIPTTDSWIYLVQYRAGSEGWNCVETDAICFFSQTYSYRDWWQAHGRIDRINTKFKDLWYYHLVSRSVIDKAIRAALKVKKNFNERDLAL